MSGRTKETHSFKVFPFLAVLICTMGSLIFLLLVTTLKIRQREAEFAASKRAYRSLEIAEAEKKAAELSEIAAKPAPEPPKVIARPAPKPAFKPVAPVDDGYELALAERKQELSALKTKWQSRAEQLASERDQRLRVLTLRRQQVQESLEKTESLNSGILQLENNLDELAGETAEATDPKEDTERVLVEQQILQMKRRLRAAQVADATEQNDQFQVVPFDPQTGTTRRPIFIECSAAGIRFLQEDILITAKDLEGFTPKANPIAAGTGALINYWNAINLKQRNPRSEPEPYVLILVRPEGVVAYYVALRMLEPIRTSQGYELIEESTVLKLPDVDSGAKTACQTAVSRLFAERENIARSALMTGSGGSVFGGAPGRRGSGGGGSGGGRPGGGVAGNSGSGSGGPGGGSMFGAVRGSGPGGTDDSGQSGGNGFTMNDLTGGDNSVGSRSWERVENFQGRPRGQSRGNDVAGGFGGESGGSFGSSGSGPRRGADSGADTGNGDGFDGGGGDGISRGSYAGIRGRSGGGTSGGTSGSPVGENGDGAEEGSDDGVTGGTSGGSGGRLAGGSGGAPGGGTFGGSGGGPGGGAVGGTGQGSATSDRGNSRMAQGSGNRSSGGNGSGNSNGTSFKGSASGGAGSGQSSEGWDESEPGMPIGQRPNRKSSKSKPGSDGESIGPEGDSDGDGRYAQGDGSSGSRSGGQSSSSRLSDSGSSSPRFSHNKGSSTRAPHPGERPSKKNNDEADKPLEPEMLAGRRWGYCEPGASIGFEREVRVDVSEDKLMIAEKFAIPVGQGESRQETLELFATALDAYSHEWGRPPQGFFWAPRLKFIVKPEGNSHYEQVNAMMTRAGLATSHEFSKQNDAIEFGRDTAKTTKPTKKPGLKAAALPKAGANR